MRKEVVVMYQKKGGIKINLIYSHWEREIIADVPACKFVYSITNLVYKRRLLWFLWQMHITEKENEWKLFMLWLYLWQRFLEEDLDNRLTNSLNKDDIEIVNEGIAALLDFMEIESIEECYPGYDDRHKITNGMCISLPL